MSTHRCKISIITVCYNSERTIEQTILSVINQSYQNVEYIIIDGKSDDGTMDVIQRYKSHITQWVSEKDDGIYDAMNKGIRMATGDVIGIINSDDWYADEAFIKVANFFSCNPGTDMIHGDAVTVSRKSNFCLARGISSQEESLLSWYYHPTMFVKKSAYETYGVYNLRYSILADAEFMLRLRLNNAKISYIRELLAYFRLTGMSSLPIHLCRRVVEIRQLVNEFYRNGMFYPHSKQEIIAELKKKLEPIAIRYIHERMHRSDMWKLYLAKLLEVHRKEKYVIWGTGKDAEKLWKDFVCSEHFLAFFIDKNPQKQREKFKGKAVYSATKDINDKLIIIGSRKYEREIKENLKAMGFAYHRDFLSIGDFYEEMRGSYIRQRILGYPYDDGRMKYIGDRRR